MAASRFVLATARGCLFTSCLFVGALVSATSVGQVRRTFDFQGLGSAPSGREKTVATAISGDGRVIVGLGQVGALFQGALRWTSDTGWEAIIPDAYGNHVNDVSADGSVIVGVQADPTNSHIYEAFRWTESTGTAQLLGSLPGGNGTSFATAVSRNGSTVVGGSRTDHDIPGGALEEQGFLWDGKMTPLEIRPPRHPEWASDVTVPPNNGGDVWSIGKNCYEVLIWRNDEIVWRQFAQYGVSGDAITYTDEGVVAVASLSYKHARWNPYRLSGPNFIVQKPLAAPVGENQTDNFSHTTDISTNGRLIVGNHRPASNINSAVVWEESGPQMVWGPFDNASEEQIGGRKVKDILLEGLSSQRRASDYSQNYHRLATTFFAAYR